LTAAIAVGLYVLFVAAAIAAVAMAEHWLLDMAAPDAAHIDSDSLIRSAVLDGLVDVVRVHARCG
jgi:hypothetical protein